MSTRFLDIFGMEHYHQLIKPVEVQSTNTTASTAWTGEIDAAGLAIGKMIIYVLPSSGTAAGETTLNLTLSDGNTTGAIPVYDYEGSRSNSHAYTSMAAYPAEFSGRRLHLFYNGEFWTVIKGPRRDVQRFLHLLQDKVIQAGSADVLTFYHYDAYLHDVPDMIFGISQILLQTNNGRASDIVISGWNTNLDENFDFIVDVYVKNISNNNITISKDNSSATISYVIF